VTREPSAGSRDVVKGRISGEGFLDLGGELEGESVETLGELADVLEEIVVGDERGNGGEEASRGGNESFGNAGSDGTKTGGAFRAETGEGVDDAPNGTEKTDEGSDASGGGEPGHAFFSATDFVGGGELHADGDGLDRFDFLRSGIAGTGDLGLEFTIAVGVDVGKGRAGGDYALWIRNALGGAKDLEELIALAADTAKESHFLEDQSPGDQGEEEKNAENGTCNPASLRKNFEDVADEIGEEQINDVSASWKTDFR